MAGLRVRGLKRSFGSVRANDGVDADFEAGLIHAVLGENGAGKSTMIKIIGGIYEPDEGTIEVGGEMVRLTSPDEARRHGVAIVHQHSALVGALTVLENVVLQFGGLGRVPEALAGALEATAGRLGFTLDPSARVESLSPGDRQRAEITRALMANARVIFLDEPTAVLGPEERTELFALLRRLADDGAAVVLVTHRLEEAIEHSDRISVLRAGRTVATIADPGATTESELIELMVGQLRGSPRREPSRVGGEVLAVRGVVGAAPGGRELHVDELVARAGEVLGVAGVEGNGQSELARLLTGAWRPSQGSVTLHGRPLADYPAGERIALIGDIPDVEAEAVCDELSVWENLALERMAYSQPPTRRNRARLRREAVALVAEFDIRTPSVEAPTGTLSGGNRRRVQLARELSKQPDLLVATYATKGLDVRSIEQVKEWCRAHVQAGGAVVFIASDLDELLDVADRIAVLASGRITGQLAAGEATTDRIGELMLGRQRIPQSA
jgi:general nucleoside transport system ATP-binding protein